jgi:enoyl-CoA hydratase/carnithine racemase
LSQIASGSCHLGSLVISHVAYAKTCYRYDQWHCIWRDFKILVNYDLAIGGAITKLSVSEVGRGIALLVGAILRLVCTIGQQRTMELILTRQIFPVQESQELVLANVVCPAGQNVVGKGVEWMNVILGHNLDYTIVTRQGLNWDRKVCSHY